MGRLGKTLLLALEAHVMVALLVWSPRAATPKPQQLAETAREIDVDIAEELAAPAVAGSGARSPAALPARARSRAAAKAPHPSTSAPPPLAARPGSATTAELAADSLVVASAGDHAGGITQARATGGPTYHPNARAWGLEGSDGTGGGGGGDLSRSARLGGTKRWSCPGPPELAGDLQPHFVRVRAEVLPDGTAVRVMPVDDEAPVLLRAALPCALAERYVPALDRGGRPVRGLTVPFRIVLAN